MLRRGWLVAAVLMLMGASAGCGGGESSWVPFSTTPTSEPEHPSLVGPRWRIVKYRTRQGELVSPAVNSDPTITFGYMLGLVNVSTGCNGGHASYEMTADVTTATAPSGVVIASVIVYTEPWHVGGERDCPGARNRQERDLAAELPLATRVTVDGAHATLRERDGTVGFQLSNPSAASSAG